MISVVSIEATIASQFASAGTFPGINGEIASTRLIGPTESAGIFVTDSNGLQARGLGIQKTFNPSWSPDGTKIAFALDSTLVGREIFVMNADDGSGLTRLTRNTVFDDEPSWSPDGTKIAFVQEGSLYPSAEIFVMNADGSGQRMLTNVGSGTDVRRDSDYSPSWSPDGTKIAFVSGRNTPRGAVFYPEIFVMNAADGSGQTNLTPGCDLGFPGRCIDPSWSPDGTKIVFSAGLDIYVMNADGTGKKNLTNRPTGVYYWEPSWSPDGTKIAFRDSAGKLYVMNSADGSGQTKMDFVFGLHYDLDWGTNPSDRISTTDWDNDGVYNGLDRDTDFSDEFTDKFLGGSTNGTITDRGDQLFTIKDAAHIPAVGVVIKSIGENPGKKPAKIELCDEGADHMVLHVTSGDQFYITCHNWPEPRINEGFTLRELRYGYLP